MWWQPSPETRFRREKYADYFNCLDRNGNGVIDRNDFGAYASLVQERLRLPKDAPELSRLRATTQALWASLRGRPELDDEDDAEARAPRREADSLRLDELVGFFVWIESHAEGELPRAARDHVLATFSVLDMDGDGSIGPEDYAVYLYAIGSEADPAAAFARLDEDGDGAISLAQIEALYHDWICAGTPEKAGNYLLTGQLPGA
ncbi:MAG TPA: EF-hand domain-containing protein [Sandaracinaceae bacterium LLY-WYZ-13_1]|nr:EF-hand domain-containing protein [Sandaracinaceae bacterium LLY-WYZ-13_1]